ncbi:helix-turn-helix transcriptional regulator [Pantoea sp. YR343]|jgi:putative transcriptional regulator|uniref:helix-turn-helix transcriptional regulator n=1 Tax=Pantoea sp. YR343 TaxID=1144341 RepID=UPI0008FB63A9|nr:helix-turn-helix transcriptional regulator [Pantoea sp. YR343]KAJ9430488.1 helix-turn-helix transcriptional regulator [Pantoea sp. YR343]
MNNLKYFRERLGLTQTELAHLAGCTSGAICHWENGRRGMDIQQCHKLVRIFKALGHEVRVDELFPPIQNIDK